MGLDSPFFSALPGPTGPWATSDFERECDAQPFVSSHQKTVLAAVYSQSGVVGCSGVSSSHISGHMWSLGWPEQALDPTHQQL